ncbi:hypothetical protein H2198_003812 [Neophaeococcomyces mojaviensis]|uniref:Uncharacterized protein n=1 Tax=Neophaeococcomyces mojaviensis TaxID=3383035 RepID=A0ACC3AAL1_9EURO|nr:hypothetical protein H2198_003812 [Knufia sp. JES_112]
MATSSIQYMPLRTELAEIRVMVIDQTDELSDVVCTLQTVPLAEANPFYALSYVWGDPHDVQSVTLDGQCIKVRKNLCDFIQSLRVAMHGPIRVWVDYLCINQKDLDERAAQVAMMDRIYSTADSVYAWLGPSTADSEKVFDFLEQSRIQRSAGEPYWKIFMSDSTVFHALEDLLGRSYWTRLWIIQEIVLAKRLWLFCGSRYISWHDLHFALAGTKAFHSTTHKRDSLHETMRLLQYLKESRESSSTMSLSKLVHKFITAQCQDERDKIYGLLSLAHQDARRLVKVDYRRPLLQVLLDTYPKWASEWVLDQEDICEANPATNSYTPSLFCQELELLFPESQLLNLYDDREIRKQITANVTFKGFWQSGTFEFRHIALIPTLEERFVPISHTRSIGREALSGPILSQMISPGGYDIFTYTTIAPLLTDKIINVGPIMLIVRQKGGKSVIVGRGIQKRCSAMEQIFDPRLWRAQLLTDSIFELKDDYIVEAAPVRRPSTRNRDDFVNVTLNAAASHMEASRFWITAQDNRHVQGLSLDGEVWEAQLWHKILSMHLDGQ